LRTKTLLDYTSRSIRLPKALLEDIKAYAKIDNRSDNAEMVMAMEQYFQSRKLLHQMNIGKSHEQEKKQAE